MCKSDKAELPPQLHEVVARLEALIGEESVSEDYVRFRIEVAKGQETVRKALAGREDSSLAPRVSPGHAGAALGEGTIQWDRALLSLLFTALCAALEKRGRDSQNLVNLRAAAEEDDALLEDLAESFASGADQGRLEALSERRGIPLAVLLFVGRTLAAPFVADAARRLKERGDVAAGTLDSSGHCPICGSPPALAKLSRDEGRRILYCALCDESWPLARPRCPFCGDQDQNALGLLAVAGVDAHWVETCDKCRRYVKTVDESKLPDFEEVIPLVADAATLHLDLLAETDGYIGAFS